MSKKSTLSLKLTNLIFTFKKSIDLKKSQLYIQIVDFK